jgi:long-chain acyl-CoA synthetase
VNTIVELLDSAADRFGDRPALRLRGDDETTAAWSYRELARRSRVAAWRCGPRPRAGRPDPDLVAVDPGAAGRLLRGDAGRRRPRSPRPADGARRDRADRRRADAKRLIVGTGRDAPDPREAGLVSFPTTRLDELAAEPDQSFPADWEAQVDGWPKPGPETIFELVFTSGTTGTPKGVMLAHDNVLASVAAMHRVIPPLDHRVVSLLPLSHLFEQAVALIYALDVGADVLYVRSRNPRVIFEAIRGHRTTSMVVVPQILELFWSAIEREVEKSGRAASFDRLRRIARHLPYAARRVLFRRVHAQLGGGLRIFVSSGAFLPPALQQAWEDLGVIVIQGYGSTETGFGTCTTREDHGLGTVGRPMPPVELRLADDGEIQFHGPTIFKGYWHDPEATAAAFTDDGWYRTGDIGRLDAAGHLVLMGRTKDIIVLPNGLNVYPEDIENALRTAGLRDSVVIESKPGRIEAVVLPPADTDGATPEAIRASIQAGVKAANATLAAHQRVAGFRIWPEDDLPRTHTLKVKRDVVRRWAAVDEPLPVREGA